MKSSKRRKEHKLKVVTDENLGYFKDKQDAFNEQKFALKGETGADIATPETPGIVKPGSDFDIAADGTITLYQAMAVNSMSVTPSQAERGSTVADVTLKWGLSKVPTSLTVNGEPVTLSEFEYMYHKNNQQQVAKMPLEKYVDMFTVYKLKVADAKAEGIDTTASFQREFNGYRNELLFPFLLDTVAEENLAKEQYERMKWNVKASHIMMKLGNNIADGNKTKARLDSIRNCILAGQSFEELALKYSIDPSVKRNKGSMGYISVGRFPWQFEDACYTTPVGEVSQVFATDYGYHIVKVYDRRPDEGKVLAEHILKLYPRNATQAQKDSVAALADSIYSLGR